MYSLSSILDLKLSSFACIHFLTDQSETLSLSRYWNSDLIFLNTFTAQSPYIGNMEFQITSFFFRCNLILNCFSKCWRHTLNISIYLVLSDSIKFLLFQVSLSVMRLPGIYCHAGGVLINAVFFFPLKFFWSVIVLIDGRTVNGRYSNLRNVG